ncbi:TPA: restriction endonuclease subunit S [Enterobacter cloacae]|uniref:restriction endonuclease subunit S n=1 Tax=Klebsiella quasipneumoniae TaxID=1463165 RepID=UPI001F06F412|nr:restriction endonuclease subunit S [Klebsiella quasipneumoniae]MCL9977236.1 restriction endonuclease subunit S [Klebsiella quasipneumoniae]UMD88242.1 restriction endonuclease subunit S [Klebsiella pneumoniae]HDT6535208.1 restriction endonuclease subunit S [Enterobacter cloacae]
MTKHRWNDSLPANWLWVEAQDCMDVRDGTHDSPKPVSEGIPLITSKNLIGGFLDFSTCSFISEEDHLSISKRSKVDNGDILYAMIGTIGNPVIVNKTKEFSIKNVALFKCSNDCVFNKYIYHFLNSSLAERQLKRKARGGTQKFISLGNLRELEIPLPPLEEQKRIASILDKADAIRQKREQAIKLADDFLRATFLEMFGDPVENPKGWKVKPLISLIVGKLQNGAYFPKDKYSKDGVEMVHMADAFYDVIQRGSLKRVQASDADIVKYSLSHEDLMISRRSLNYEGAAKPSLIPHSDEPLIFESSMIRITPDKKQIDKLFLFYYLTDPLVKEHFIRKFVTGATIKGINQKNLEQVRIIVPPLELQKEFSYIVHALEKNKKKLNESEILSIEQFTTISQRAFLGQL